MVMINYFIFQATAVNFDLVLPKISYYKQKEVITKSWNAPLSFGEVFGIKVCGYEKVFTNPLCLINILFC